MITEWRGRILGLAALFAESVADAKGLSVSDLAQEWRDWAEAAALFVFAETELDRSAALGAFVYTAAHLHGV